MNITIRQKERIKNISLVLDITHEGQRQQETLGIYLEKPNGKPLSPAQKKHNKQKLELAETIKAKRILEFQKGQFGLKDPSKNQSFIEYIEGLAKQRLNSEGNHGNWDSAIKHLKKFLNNKDVKFREINKEWLQRFKDYLLYQAIGHGNKPLAQNSKCSYFNKIRAALKEAFRDNLIPVDVVGQVKSIKAGQTMREYLTLDELNALNKTECEIPFIKQAFMFSALTGLRHSDIMKLKWEDVRKEPSGYSIRFKQQKTGTVEYHPISDEARKQMGSQGNHDEKVFKGLKYSAWYNFKLAQWVMKAGITKNITFHCARHTYATLQLSAGTDIYTVSKLLGHTQLKTTQVYAKVMDEQKRQAADKIKLR